MKIENAILCLGDYKRGMSYSFQKVLLSLSTV